MDMHIHMSYCRFSGFKQLALNYLGIYHHKLFSQIEEQLTKVEITPAEVAGELMKNTNVKVSLQGLLKFLEHKIAEQDKSKTKAEEEEAQVNEETNQELFTRQSEGRY